MGEEEETDSWVRQAKKDDSMVVELLLRLKHSRLTPPPTIEKKIFVPPVSSPFEWGIRLPRSRPLIQIGDDNNNNNNPAFLIKKNNNNNAESSNRSSPTTPLSWNGGGSGGGTSLSGCAGAAVAAAAADCDGVVVVGGGGGATTSGGGDSSLPIVTLETAAVSSGGRSKGHGTNEQNNKRSKKKTFAEVKESESLVSKENIRLKRDLAAQRLACEELRAKNVQLKKMKLDFTLQSAKRITSSPDVKDRLGNQSQRRDETVETTPPSLLMFGTFTNPEAPKPVDVAVPASAPKPGSTPIDPRSGQRDVQPQIRSFELPDLNIPVDDDSSGSDILYGIS